MAKIWQAGHRRKSRSVGPRLSRPAPEVLPYAREALAWLLDLPPDTRAAAVFQRARIAGVIQGRGQSWLCDRALLERGAARPRARTQVVTSQIAYGLGELFAYTHRGSMPAILPLKHLSEKDAEAFLCEVTKLANAEYPPPAVDEITARELLQHKTLDGQTMDYAYAFLQHSRRPRPMLFGLSVITETTARYHPAAFARWLSQSHSAAVHHTVLNYLVERLIFADAEDGIHTALLKSGNPVLQGLVTQSFVTRHFGQKPAGFDELFEMCKRAGLPDPDAFILALPGAAHQISPLRFVREAARSANAALAFAYLESQQANSNSISELKAKADAATSELETVEKNASAAINTMVDHWPAGGLSKEGVSFFQLNTGLSRSEVRYRVAEKLAPSQGRTDLLDSIVADLSQILDIEEPARSVQQRLYDQASDFLQSVHWCGAAMGLRSENETKGLGQRTSQYVGPLVAAGRKITDAPFAAARRTYYGAALSKRIGAALFALHQSCPESTVPPDLVTLANLVLDEAEGILAAEVGTIGDEQLFDQLAVDCLALMESNPRLDRRTRWVADSGLSIFARALSMWTSPVLAAGDPQLARTLFLDSGGLRSARRSERSQNRGCLVLDAALSNLPAGGSGEQVGELRVLWSEVTASWPAPAQENALRVFDALVDGLSGSASGTRFVLTDPGWRPTRCGQKIAKLP